MPRNPLKNKPPSDRAIRYKCSLQNTILEVLRERPGWQEATGEMDWDFYWCDAWWMKETFDHAYLEEHMRLNHFRNHYELTRKNLMVKNLKRLRRQLERESGKLEAQKCDFFPSTYELPVGGADMDKVSGFGWDNKLRPCVLQAVHVKDSLTVGNQPGAESKDSEYHIFVDEFRKNPGSVWIMKPIAKSQGKGIFLFKRLKDITDWKKGTEYLPTSDPNRETPETYVVQRYIENPYLIGGRKFDIRVYCLITSYGPLKVWLYRNGFARFSNTRFSLESIDDNYVHLTNVAIQKTAPDYDPEKGCKWSTQQLRKYLTAKHGQEQIDKLFHRMNELFILSLQSVQKIMINDKHCFELYGYDILIDNNLKPWLIEINASPSLTASSKEDSELKCGLLNDVLNIIDMENRLTGKEKRIGGFDLLWDDGPVYLEDAITSDSINNYGTAMNSFLGCNNDRRENLKQVFQSAQLMKKTTQ